MLPYKTIPTNEIFFWQLKYTDFYEFVNIKTNKEALKRDYYHINCQEKLNFNYHFNDYISTDENYL